MDLSWDHWKYDAIGTKWFLFSNHYQCSIFFWFKEIEKKREIFRRLNEKNFFFFDIDCFIFQSASRISIFFIIISHKKGKFSTKKSKPSETCQTITRFAISVQILYKMMATNSFYYLFLTRNSKYWSQITTDTENVLFCSSNDDNSYWTIIFFYSVLKVIINHIYRFSHRPSINIKHELCLSDFLSDDKPNGHSLQ